MLEISESALVKIKDLLIDENKPGIKLRIFVQGGGCSGFQYGFTFDEVANEDDFVVEKEGIEILVDSASGMYLQGATINYKEELMGSSFSIDNPNAQATCGCGSSFAPY
jgi:iron-sulfur cluster insertion protein